MARDADPPVPDDAPAPQPAPSAAPEPRPPSLPRAESAAPSGAAPAAGTEPGRGIEIQGETVEAAAPAAAPPKAPPPRAKRESPLAFGLAFAWRSKRALWAILLVQLLFGASIALPFRARVGPHLDHHVRASAFAGAPDVFDKSTGWTEPGLDWGVWADVKRREAPFFEGLGLAMVWVAILAWLFGQAVAGGFLGTAAEDLAAREGAAAPQKGRATRFLAAAGTWFFPSLRVSLVFLAVTMLLGRRVIFEAWGGIAGEAEAAADSQAAAWWGMRTREGAFLLLFVVLRAAADLGRAHLVVRGRRSACLSFLRGIGTLARHPLKAGGLAVLVAVPEMLLLFALSRLIPGFPSATTPQLVAVFAIFQAAVLVRWTARAVLLAGNVRLLAREPQPAPR